MLLLPKSWGCILPTTRVFSRLLVSLFVFISDEPEVRFYKYCQAEVTCNDAEMHSQMDKLLEDTDQKVATLHDTLQQAQLETGHLTSMLAADKKAHTVALDALQHQVDHVHPKQIQLLHDKVILTTTTLLQVMPFTTQHVFWGRSHAPQLGLCL